MDSMQAKDNYRTASTLYKQGEYGNASSLLEELLQTFPDNPELLKAKDQCNTGIMQQRAKSRKWKTAIISSITAGTIAVLGGIYSLTYHSPNYVNSTESAVLIESAIPKSTETAISQFETIQTQEHEYLETIAPKKVPDKQELINKAYTHQSSDQISLSKGTPNLIFSEQRNPQVEAIVSNNPPSITLHWKNLEKTGTWIYKRPKDNYELLPDDAQTPIARNILEKQTWKEPTKLDKDTLQYTDLEVEIGKTVEYKILNQTGFGSDYIVSGIEIPLNEHRGKILILTDTKETALEKELNQTKKDMTGDGWEITTHTISPQTSVKETKKRIIEIYEKEGINAILLLGRIPVPYSGPSIAEYVSDGHGEHMGAWPSDNFYFDIDGIWTDTLTCIVAKDPRNQNRPNDGKFDQFVNPSDIELMGGRVDLSSMPAFQKTETELLKQYLQKNHAFKTGQTKAARRTLVYDEEFKKLPYGLSAWMLASVTGGDNFYRADWNNLKQYDFLFAAGTAGGWFEGANGIAHTEDYAKHEYKAIFQILFGSWFGDWDTPNNFLRAPLCQEKYGLISVWGFSPVKYFDHMAIGEPIGYSAKMWVNNYGFWVLGNGSPHGQTHGTLLGDPTLRMEYPKPVSNVEAQLENGRVQVTWQTSPEEGILEQRIYRSQKEFSDFERIATLETKAQSFEDKDAPAGKNFYMVRAVKLTVSPSGSYFNGSIGQFAEVVK